MRNQIAGVGENLPLRVGFVDLLPDSTGVVYIQMNDVSYVEKELPRLQLLDRRDDIGLVDRLPLTGAKIVGVDPRPV